MDGHVCMYPLVCIYASTGTSTSNNKNPILSHSSSLFDFGLPLLFDCWLPGCAFLSCPDKPACVRPPPTPPSNGKGIGPNTHTHTLLL